VYMSLGWLVVEHNCVNIGVFIDFCRTTTCFGLYRPSSGCFTRGKDQ